MTCCRKSRTISTGRKSCFLSLAGGVHDLRPSDFVVGKAAAGSVQAGDSKTASASVWKALVLLLVLSSLSVGQGIYYLSCPPVGSDFDAANSSTYHVWTDFLLDLNQGSSNGYGLIEGGHPVGEDISKCLDQWPLRAYAHSYSHQ